MQLPAQRIRVSKKMEIVAGREEVLAAPEGVNAMINMLDA
jgi:hypothetical protein